MKAITDLDDLVQALRGALPWEKPCQRQLHTFLGEADRQVQVLRLTIALRKGDDELRQVVTDVQSSLRAANAYVSAGRADMGTKMAVRLALDLGGKLGAAVQVRA